MDKLHHRTKFHQNLSIHWRYINFSIFKDGGRLLSWICLGHIWTTHKGFLAVYHCQKFACNWCSSGSHWQCLSPLIFCCLNRAASYVALHCGCSVPAAELLDSSRVGIARLVLHTAEESILCMRGDDAALPKVLWDFLLSKVKDFSKPQTVTYTVKVTISRKRCWMKMLQSRGH